MKKTIKLLLFELVVAASASSFAGCGNNAGKGSEVVKGNVPEGSVMTVGDVNISEGLFSSFTVSISGRDDDRSFSHFYSPTSMIKGISSCSTTCAAIIFLNEPIL